ncbi:MAG TPA: type II secretion system major pseudopilin GspG [Spirochaetota bacterium]|nr:type II secretion system major pseudopilin GspG [Spirochaetota bacterium]HPI89177.1 type II secretion system major pseudopilin GspG [Spirochaetota bacterium]HPR46828.1 type II secretion system major pseudopilin GspG [Spirochaetota bacterium]
MTSLLKKRLHRLFSQIRNERAFTLLEIMIVVTIIAILGALVVPRFMDMPKKANVTAAKTQIQNFSMALDKYALEKGNYPTTDEGLQALVQDGIMKKIPPDPWGNPYQYRSPGENDPDYEIMSFGADGKEGGEEYDADIKSWE